MTSSDPLSARGPEVDSLIARVAQLQFELVRLTAPDRFAPLLATSLTIQQLKVLIHVWLQGPVSHHHLAEDLGVSAATLTGIVDRLAERDLLARQVDPDDRRVRRVALTTAGAALIADLELAHRTSGALLLSRLRPQTLRNLGEALEELTGLAREEAARRPCLDLESCVPFKRARRRGPATPR